VAVHAAAAISRKSSSRRSASPTGQTRIRSAPACRYALRAQGFRVRGLLHGTVRGQRPGPRTPAEPAQTAVTLLGTAPAVPPLRPVSIRTVAAGSIASSLQRRTGLVVKSEKRWRALWRQLTAGDDPPREPP
jgi:hypothetical protein